MANAIGRATIEVVPDVSRFASRLSRDLGKVIRKSSKLNFDINVRRIRQASAEFLKLNAAIRATSLGFVSLGVQAATGGVFALAGAVGNLSGVLGVVPGLAVAGGVALGALKIGLTGVSDAFKNFSDPEKFRESLEGLSKNAKETLLVFDKLRPKIEELKNSVQDALFDDLSVTVEKLAEKFLPRLQKAFTNVAGQINLATRDVAAFLAKASTLRDVDSIFGQVGGFFERLRPAIVPLAQALRDVLTVSSQFLPFLGGAITAATQKFADFIARIRESGELAEFIGKGIVAFERLSEIIGNLAKSVASVFTATSDAGSTLLDILSDATGQLADFLKSAEGQNSIKALIDGASIAFDALFPVLEAAVEVFTQDFVPIVANFAKIIGPALVTIIHAFGDALEAAAPGIEAFAQGFADFLVGIAPALPALGQLAGVIGTALGGVLRDIAPILTQFIIALVNELTPVLPGLIKSIGTLAIAFIGLLEKLTPLIGPLTDLVIVVFDGISKFLSNLSNEEIDAFIGYIDSLLGVLEELVPLVVDVLIPAFGLFLIALKPITVQFQILAAIISGVSNAVSFLFEGLKDLTGSETGGGLLGLLSLTSPLAFGLGTITVAALKSENAFQHLIDKATAAANASQRTSSTWQGSMSAMQNAVTLFSTDAGTAFNNTQAVGDALTQSIISNWIPGFIRIQTEGSGAFNRLQESAKSSFGAMGDRIQEAFNRIRGIINPSLDDIKAKNTATFNEMAASAGRSAGQLPGLFSGALGEVNRQFVIAANNAAAQGAALGGGFAGGIRNSIGSAVAAAQALANSVTAWLPGSPAKVGPLSGRGWTPYRGAALVEGFAEGMKRELALVSSTASQVATAASSLGTAGATVNTSDLNANSRFATSLSTTVSPSLTTGATTVSVFIGDTELTQLVDNVVIEHDRQLKRSVVSGNRRVA